ncbi:MAG: RsfS/YbeB/iojap family protein [Nitrospira sp.]|nr:RsfS/YbeB/iojap family protein [Nitrospira sp.]
MLEKKALDVQVLHVAPLTSIADYLVIGSAESDRQTRAVADSIVDELSRIGQTAAEHRRYGFRSVGPH